MPKDYRYIAFTTGASLRDYDAAQEECEGVGSGLAIIRNQSDWDALQTTVKQSRITVMLEDFHFSKMWISGRKRSSNWRWYTDEIFGEDWPFWAQNQPNVDGEACARIRTSPDSWMSVADAACAAMTNSFICE